jgi:hypothetical protein
MRIKLPFSTPGTHMDAILLRLSYLLDIVMQPAGILFVFSNMKVAIL